MITICEEKGLPDTKSRRMRSYDLAYVGIALCDYLLVFRQGKPGLKEYECGAYAIQVLEEPPAPFALVGMHFLIAKIDPPADDKDKYEVYSCFIPESKNNPGTCSCVGQNTQRVCKHVDALADAMRS